VPYFHFIWTAEIVEHIAEHGISQDDFEHVVCQPARKFLSRRSGLPACAGFTPEGRYIMAVYELVDSATVLPVTAYEVPEPR
jgi:hypothetical protein